MSIVTKKAVRDKADKCLDLCLILDKITIDPNVSLWVNTCDNARRMYPRRANLRLAQLESLSRQED